MVAKEWVNPIAAQTIYFDIRAALPSAAGECAAAVMGGADSLEAANDALHVWTWMEPRPRAR